MGNCESRPGPGPPRSASSPSFLTFPLCLVSSLFFDSLSFGGKKNHHVNSQLLLRTLGQTLLKGACAQFRSTFETSNIFVISTLGEGTRAKRAELSQGYQANKGDTNRHKLCRS